MANPKYRTSKSKKHKRRAHDFLANPAYGFCPSCNEVKRPHAVCSNCGYYKGKQVMKPRPFESKSVPTNFSV